MNNDLKRKATKRKTIWKVLLVFLPILAVCIYYLADWIPLVPVGYTRIILWWEEKTRRGPEKWEEEYRAYLEKLKPPKLTGKEVAELLEKEKVIKTQELYDMANWYVREEDEMVIRQLIANYQFQMTVSLPEERGGKSSTIVCHASGRYLVPLGSTRTATQIWHHELLKYAESKDTNPRFIYFIMRNMPVNDRKTWFFEQVFRDDILSYLRIYANYKSWPTIRDEIKDCLTRYRCGWRDWDTIDEVLKTADEEGPKQAYDLFMRRYQDNYRHFSGTFHDFKDRAKTYKYEAEVRGWCSENIESITRIYNVDSEGTIIVIPGIRKIHSVLRDGNNITSVCELRPENDMIIPLEPAQVTELRYTISITPAWWNRYVLDY